MRILMVGLDAAGKTTILYKLKLGEVEKPIALVIGSKTSAVGSGEVQRGAFLTLSFAFLFLFFSCYNYPYYW